ncbi:SDR family oxidoreductase [Fictibacillus enclensis]|uniref:SDR family oxidoreductase n=1 Tax=Fictibacillus enclensis TaxID=1017270 RepID=UPI0025A1A202|nr:SDR family oxidoreductase [Fictibacillus enclensis]MDM5335756.1 SDR family oxidoreductase [Fictibacillus enclensis]
MEQMLTGKHIVLLGASTGIGWDTAHLLRKQGANLSLGSRSITKRRESWNAIHGNCSQSFLENVDITDEKSIINFKEKAIDRFGAIDVLINSAGVGYFSPAEKFEIEVFKEMININLIGTFLTCQSFGKEMLQQGFGRIYNIISVAGKIGLEGCAGYSASKFGVTGFSKVLQAEWRKKGIQVTSVYPGAINSSFWNQLEETPDKAKMISTHSFAKSMVSLIQLPDESFVDEITIMPPHGVL